MEGENPERHGPARVRLRAVALPSEHGGWGFLAEAVALALLAAPGPACVPLALAALAGFLAHHPARLWLTDRLRGRAVPRTRVAARLAAWLAAAAAVALAAALLRAPRPAALIAPLVIALGLAAVQLALHVRGRGRALPAELLGAAAPGGVAAAAAAGDGLGIGPAALLWALLLGRGLPAVLFVRARLRKGRGEPAQPAACHASHAGALAAATALAAGGALPPGAALVFAALWLRAALGLAWRRPLRPQALGIAELAVGVAAAAALGAALRGAR